MLSVVSARYARALVDVVTAPGSKVDPAQVLSQLRAVQEMVHGSPVLQHALNSPAVSPSRKRAVMRRILEPMGCLATVRNFVYVVIDHRRAHNFASIVDGFETLLDERLGFVAAEVRSATPLTAAQTSQLEAQVSRLAGRKAKLRFSSDPALIGGVVARVGSTVYDGSVRGQLERLRTKLGAG
jgi:F-type H+-transporting ATPase subunit delta